MRTMLLASAACGIAASPAFANAKNADPKPDPAPANTETPVAATDEATKARVAPVLVGEIRTDVPIPETTSKRGSKSSYPFDSLTVVGASFAVANKSAKDLSAIVSAVNRKNMVVKTDPATNMPVKRTIKGVLTDKNEMTPTKAFKAFDVTDEPGVTARVFRTL